MQLNSGIVRHIAVRFRVNPVISGRQIREQRFAGGVCRGAITRAALLGYDRGVTFTWQTGIPVWIRRVPVAGALAIE